MLDYTGKIGVILFNIATAEASKVYISQLTSKNKITFAQILSPNFRPEYLVIR
jgi:hypothetical protein